LSTALPDLVLGGATRAERGTGAPALQRPSHRAGATLPLKVDAGGMPTTAVALWTLTAHRSRQSVPRGTPLLALVA